MDYGQAPEIAPSTPAAQTSGKLPYAWIGQGALVLTVLSMSGSGGSVSASTKSPIQGQWNLVDTDQAAYSQTYQDFRSDGSATDVKGGVRHAYGVKEIVYDVKPTYVVMSYGGPNYETWNLTGPDDLPLTLTSPYSVKRCRYRRT
jgi:hypothetical protein